MKPHTPTESEAQQAVMKWWAMAHKGLGVRHERLLMAFPMQGLRTARNGARMKAEGMRAGLADMFLAVPIKRTHLDDRNPAWTHQSFIGGLWIELKRERPRGVVSPEQSEFLDIVREQGYAAQVCYGFDECTKAITEYLTSK